MTETKKYPLYELFSKILFDCFGKRTDSDYILETGEVRKIFKGLQNKRNHWDKPFFYEKGHNVNSLLRLFQTEKEEALEETLLKASQIIWNYVKENRLDIWYKTYTEYKNCIITPFYLDYSIPRTCTKYISFTQFDDYKQIEQKSIEYSIDYSLCPFCNQHLGYNKCEEIINSSSQECNLCPLKFIYTILYLLQEYDIDNDLVHSIKPLINCNDDAEILDKLSSKRIVILQRYFSLIDISKTMSNRVSYLSISAVYKELCSSFFNLVDSLMILITKHDQKDFMSKNQLETATIILIESITFFMCYAHSNPFRYIKDIDNYSSYIKKIEILSTILSHYYEKENSMLQSMLFLHVWILSIKSNDTDKRSEYESKLNTLFNKYKEYTQPVYLQYKVYKNELSGLHENYQSLRGALDNSILQINEHNNFLMNDYYPNIWTNLNSFLQNNGYKILDLPSNYSEKKDLKRIHSYYDCI